MLALLCATELSSHVCLPDYKTCMWARRFIQHNELTGKNKNKTIHNIKGSDKRVPPILDLGTRKNEFQIHAPAALLPEEKPAVYPSNMRSYGRLARSRRFKENNLFALSGNPTTNPRLYTRSLVTISTTVLRLLISGTKKIISLSPFLCSFWQKKKSLYCCKAPQNGWQYLTNDKIVLATKRITDRAVFTAPVLYALSAQKASFTARTAEQDGVKSSWRTAE
jgi:hypothetical protein